LPRHRSLSLHPPGQYSTTNYTNSRTSASTRHRTMKATGAPAPAACQGSTAQVPLASTFVAAPSHPRHNIRQPRSKLC
jgi:hypothetical protein